MSEPKVDPLRIEVIGVINLVTMLLSGNEGVPLLQQKMSAMAVEVLQGYEHRLVTGEDIKLSEETREFLTDFTEAFNTMNESDAEIMPRSLIVQ